MESYADITGELFEYWMTGDSDWVSGGELSVPWRNLANPGATVDAWYGLGYPDRFYSSNFVCGGSNPIHHNSTVPSKAFYLISEGGVFNGYTVKASASKRSSRFSTAP